MRVPCMQMPRTNYDRVPRAGQHEQCCHFGSLKGVRIAQVPL